MENTSDTIKSNKFFIWCYLMLYFMVSYDLFWIISANIASTRIDKFYVVNVRGLTWVTCSDWSDGLIICANLNLLFFFKLWAVYFEHWRLITIGKMKLDQSNAIDTYSIVNCDRFDWNIWLHCVQYFLSWPLKVDLIWADLFTPHWHFPQHILILFNLHFWVVV